MNERMHYNSWGQAPPGQLECPTSLVTALALHLPVQYLWEARLPRSLVMVVAAGDGISVLGRPTPEYGTVRISRLSQMFLVIDSCGLQQTARKWSFDEERLLRSIVGEVGLVVH